MLQEYILIMKIERFEDIEAWKEARILTRIIYDISSNGEFSRDFNLRNQIRSASVSTMSNISDGFDRGSDKDFIKFLVIARASTLLYFPHSISIGYNDKVTLTINMHTLICALRSNRT